MQIRVTKRAKQFLKDRNINDVTFELKELDVSGCCIGIAKEIEPVYAAPQNASTYHYVQLEGCHLFISREIRIIGPLTLATEGFWRYRRLCLLGSSIPI